MRVGWVAGPVLVASVSFATVVEAQDGSVAENTTSVESERALTTHRLDDHWSFDVGLSVGALVFPADDPVADDKLFSSGFALGARHGTYGEYRLSSYWLAGHEDRGSSFRFTFDLMPLRIEGPSFHFAAGLFVEQSWFDGFDGTSGSAAGMVLRAGHWITDDLLLFGQGRTAFVGRGSFSLEAGLMFSF